MLGFILALSILFDSSDCKILFFRTPSAALMIVNKKTRDFRGGLVIRPTGFILCIGKEFRISTVSGQLLID